MIALLREAASASLALGRQVWIWRGERGRLCCGFAFRPGSGVYLCRMCGRALVR